jgi:NAD(P)-dependent dehydrogenase (short-subunit alcohol dehydrogenase family)
MEIAGRTAFVTGGAGGIGLAVARKLIEAGARVAIADVNEQRLTAAMAELAGGDAMPVRLDVADRVAFAAAADAAEAELGPVSIVFNNAGVNLFGALDQCSYEEWDWLLGVNLHGVVNGIQTFVPRLKERGDGGQIVNTASMASFLAGASGGIYTTTKFAVRGLTESLRWCLAPYRIGVSCLCPGPVRSPTYGSKMGLDVPESGSEHDAEFLACLGALDEFGMDPAEVAERTIEGIRQNSLYIFPHAEYRDELEAHFQDILDAFPAPGGDAALRRAGFGQHHHGRGH